ncbi:MAG: PIN domain-containing protein [Fimbriimonadaceae bacterium]
MLNEGHEGSPDQTLLLPKNGEGVPPAIEHPPVQYGRLILTVLSGCLGAFLLFGLMTPALIKLIDARNMQPPADARALVFAQFACGVTGFLGGVSLSTLFMVAGRKLVNNWENLSTPDKVTFFVGVFLGLVASVPFIFLIYAMVNQNIAWLMATMLVVIGGFSMGSVYVLNTMTDILPWYRGHARGRRRGLKILDTNVIIDGRIYEVWRAGFLEGQLYVPGFCLEELQFIADSHDALRRQRGRRGLDMLRLLQSDLPLEVGLHDRYAGSAKDEVDTRLVRLAIALGADIVTNDSNLNRVAKLQNVRVLNINELAMGLRPNLLPQEVISLPVSREGNQPYQGVGYLDDGTMVVVDNAKQHIGHTVEVVVTQVIQTERGKMIFGQLASALEQENGGL